MALTSIVGGVAAPALAMRFGARNVTAAGLAIGAAAMIMLIAFHGNLTYVPVMISSSLVGLGTGALAVGSSVIMCETPVEKASSAASLEEISYDLGNVLGVAILGSVASIVYRLGLDPAALAESGLSGAAIDEAMQSFDVLVVDMQDVGLRFYTYYITMLRMMDACAEFGRTVVVLDRPNPNGHLIDGPVLDMKYKSGVGALPIPVLHGLTMGEIARMAVGEGWSRKCRLDVVCCRNYTHATPYGLPVAPSPNLPTQRAVYLYPSLCLFEGTVVSLGRGTDKPFEIYGHPDMKGYGVSFTPRPTAGAKHPPLEGRHQRNGY